MKYLDERIIPYEGLDTFKFGMSLESVRSELKDNHIAFNQCTNTKDDSHPEIERVYIKIGDSISLYFANSILYEIILENDFRGVLPNGCCIGFDMDELETIDRMLKYDDDEEAFISSAGYLIIDDIETKKVSLIEIYIPEVENEEEYFTYEWLKKYQ